MCGLFTTTLSFFNVHKSVGHPIPVTVVSVPSSTISEGDIVIDNNGFTLLIM